MRLSISKIKAFKSCRRLYELRYVEGLQAVTKPDALEIGTSYHEHIDMMNKDVNAWLSCNKDFDKPTAMAIAYYKYIYPQFHVVESEKQLEYDLGNGDKLIGIADGIADDGHIVEHKTTSRDIAEGGEYEYNLLWDEQILAYMLMTGKRKVWYTVCRKPTIRQKKDETEEEFFYRMVAWYDEDTATKIRLFEIERTDVEVEAFRDELMQMADEMRHAGYFYRNTCHCSAFGRRCEYSSICLHYDPNQPCLEFVRRENE